MKSVGRHILAFDHTLSMCSGLLSGVVHITQAASIPAHTVIVSTYVYIYIYIYIRTTHVAGSHSCHVHVCCTCPVDSTVLCVNRVLHLRTTVSERCSQIAPCVVKLSVKTGPSIMI